MPDKRANEWSILRTVYDVNKYAEIQESERPNFLLRHTATMPAFGVEVTELFANEAEARSVNHPGYLPALFEGAPHMHKADPKLLQVARFRITDADGELKHEDLPGILTQIPSELQHRESLAAVIRSKSSRGYVVDGSHVNLVIRDRFRRSGEPRQDEYSISDMLSGSVREALIESPFQEVHLITVLRDGEQVVRPLQQLMLAERFFLFGKAMEATLGRNDMDEQWKYVQAFTGFCERSGMPVTLLSHAGHPVAVYRSNAVGLGDDWGSEILDFANSPGGMPEWEWREEFVPLTEQELGACSEWVAANGFVWGFYGSAQEPAVLQYPHVRTVLVTEVPAEG